MSAEKTLEEKKARILIGLRGYKLSKREEQGNIVSFIVETPRKENAIIWCVLTEGAVGVQYINKLSKAMKEAEIDKGILITGGRYTHAAKVNANRNRIELISRIFPSFNLFEHTLVPKHEILSPEEQKKVLMEYRVRPYQMPQIRSSDPAAKAIGAEPGDIVKIIRESPTAGKYISYRYVIED